MDLKSRLRLALIPYMQVVQAAGVLLGEPVSGEQLKCSAVHISRSHVRYVARGCGTAMLLFGMLALQAGSIGCS